MGNEDKGLAIGDTIRISVALLRELYDAPGHTSVVVRLADVQQRREGEKLIILATVDSQKDYSR